MKPKKEPFVYDRTLRDILQSIPVEFVRLLTNKTAVELLETSFPKVEEKRADLVVRLDDESIFHLEIQSCSDSSMPKRMLKYAGLIYELYDIFPSQMVLYIGNRKTKFKNEIKIKKENSSIDYKYDVKLIKDFDCKILIESDSIDDNILATLCKIKNVDNFINRLKDKLFALDNKKQEDYMRKLFYLLRLRPNLHQKIYNKQKKELAMPFVLDRRIDPLYKEGMEIGVAKGVAKERREGILQMIELILKLKFHSKPQWLYYLKNIKDIDKFTKIKDFILNAKTIDEVEKFIKTKIMI